jgi:hypothetical protein
MLSCNNCPLEKIPSLTNLIYLDYSSSPLLKVISPNLPYLQSLICYNCPLLKKIPSTLTSLKTLYFSNCSLIKKIPSTLTNLQELCCINCPLIKEIPSTLTNLQQLTCRNCPLIKEIPSTLSVLSSLYCEDCTSLYYIGIKNKPLTRCYLKNTYLNNYNWVTHKGRFKYKIAVRKINEFMYKFYIRIQKKRILALQLWRYGLQDVREIILEKLIK